MLQNKLRNRSQIEFKEDEENVRVLRLHLLNIELTSSVKKAQLELHSLLAEQKQECSERLNHAGLLTIMW